MAGLGNYCVALTFNDSVLIPVDINNSMKPYGFIYITTNLINGKRYLGQSRKPVNAEYFGSGKAIVRALKKYGVGSFSREVIAVAFSRADLNFLEEHFIHEFNAATDRDWYNISSAPNRTFGFKGRKHTKERNKLMSDLLLGHPVLPETKQKMKNKWVARKARNNESWIGSPEHLEQAKKQAKITGSKNAKPITVSGITYSSCKEACKVLGVSFEKLKKLASPQ